MATALTNTQSVVMVEGNTSAAATVTLTVPSKLSPEHFRLFRTLISTSLPKNLFFSTINPVCNVTSHECTAKPGKVLVDSIKIYTESCDGCSAADEGVVVHLLGEKNGEHLDGVPCHTNRMDHAGSTDFGPGSTEFNGRINGQEDQTEKNMMGGCYEVRIL